jgi:hypothetical protein
MDRWMDWDGVVWGGQSTPGWKWRRIVYQQKPESKHLYQRFFNCQSNCSGYEILIWRSGC